MLKKSSFSPPRPRRIQTRLFPGFVLASLKGSTLSRSELEVGTLEGLFRSPRPIIGRLAGLFEHSAGAVLLSVTCKGRGTPMSFTHAVVQRSTDILGYLDERSHVSHQTWVRASLARLLDRLTDQACLGRALSGVWDCGF